MEGTTKAIEGAFQGGSLGEVSASKIASALALARRARERGNRLNNADAVESVGQ
jgi:acetyl-CoA carboxylase beta subunit